MPSLLVSLLPALVLSTPTQLRLTFSGEPNALVAAWTTVGTTDNLAQLQYGPTSSLGSSSPSTYATWTNDLCSNSSRTSYRATLPVAPGASVYYRVGSDAGGWSGITQAFNAPSSYPSKVALCGDLGVECGGILPPTPGSYYGGQCTSVPQLILDSNEGKHDHTILFGDSAYNMDERCGEKGDAFLVALSNFSSFRPHVFSNGNHEGGPAKQYSEFYNRLGYGQVPLSNASGSTNPRWGMWSVGPVTFVHVDPDAWIYPLVYPLLDQMYAWLEGAMKTIDRIKTPWVVFTVHRAMYCTKVLTDAECLSEAETIRNGQLGVRAPLEKILAQYGVDFYFAGHTHHYLRTFPVVRNHSTAHDYIHPRGTVHIQSGIAGTGGSDPFTAPQLEYEAFRDTLFVPTYGRLTFFNDTMARYEQLFNDNGTVYDSFDLIRGPPPYGTPF